MCERIKNFCRCCAKPLNTTQTVPCTQELSEKIYELTGCDLNEVAEVFDCFVCFKCDERLKNVDIFKAEIREAQKNLKAIVGIESYEDQQYAVKVECLDEPPVVESFPVFVKEEEQLFPPSEFLSPLVKTETEGSKIQKTKLQSIRGRQKKPSTSKATKRSPITKITSDVKPTPRKRRAKTEADHHCPICNKYFTEHRKIDLHIARVHKGERNYSCDQCSYKAFKKYEVYLHFISMHAKKENLQKTSICNYCGEGFPTRNHLTRHMNRKHLQHISKKHICDICGNRYEALNEMKRHIQTHLPPELQQVFKCDICGRILHSKGALKTHKEQIHTKVTPIECFCGKVLQTKCAYQRHLKTIHMGVKAYKCTECSKEFSGKNHLDYHMKAWHIPVVMIPCDVCGQKYKTEESLKRHQLHHFDPRFSCSLCDAKFYENRKLMDHQSVHQKLPFSCPFCPRTFRLESQVRSHGKKCHNTEKLTFKCEKCTSSFTRKSTYRDHALRQHKDLNEQEMADFLVRIRQSIADEHKNQSNK